MANSASKKNSAASKKNSAASRLQRGRGSDLITTLCSRRRRRDVVVAGCGGGGGEVDLRGRWRCGSEMREGDMSFFSFLAVQNFQKWLSKIIGGRICRPVLGLAPSFRT